MKKLGWILAVTFLVSCSSQRAVVDYDRNQNFAELTDFSFDIRGGEDDNLDMRRVESAVANELAKKGMVYVDSSPIKVEILPQKYLSKQQSSSVGVGLGGGRYGFGGGISVGIPVMSQKLNQNYQVSIYNREYQMVWQGKLEIQMPANAKPEAIEANIQKGVQKLFKDYPPQP